MSYEPYPWSWMGKMKVGWFGPKFNVVRLSEAHRLVTALKERIAELEGKSPKPKKPETTVEKKLLKDIQDAGGHWIIAHTLIERDDTVITTAALKLKDRYYIGIARETRPREMDDDRARVVALGRAWKAATRGWSESNDLLDIRLGRIAGPVDMRALPEYLLQKEDRTLPC